MGVHPCDVFVHTGIEEIHALVSHCQLSPQQFNVLQDTVGIDGECLLFDGQRLRGVEHDGTVGRHAVGGGTGDIHLTLQKSIKKSVIVVEIGSKAE